jgi:SET domain-containing protein
MRVGPSQIAGDGLFATRPIAAGTTIARLSGRVVDTAELLELLTRPPVDTIALDEDRHLILPTEPRPLVAYGNHSCDPNAWWVDEVTLVARRDIAPGEEVTSDYGTSTGIRYVMKCDCRAAICRGTITGDDWQLPELQQRYGDHWVPMLLRRQRGRIPA